MWSEKGKKRKKLVVKKRTLCLFGFPAATTRSSHTEARARDEERAVWSAIGVGLITSVVYSIATTIKIMIMITR